MSHGATGSALTLPDHMTTGGGKYRGSRAAHPALSSAAGVVAVEADIISNC
jgi:hypothetical protein